MMNEGCEQVHCWLFHLVGLLQLYLTDGEKAKYS